MKNPKEEIYNGLLVGIREYFQAHPEATEWRGAAWAMLQLLKEHNPLRSSRGFHFTALPTMLEIWKSRGICYRQFDNVESRFVWVFLRSKLDIYQPLNYTPN